MISEIKTYARENGEIQRVQAVRLEDWNQLDFLCLKQENDEQKLRALNCFRDIYVNFLVPASPWVFPQMAMFTLPMDMREDVAAIDSGVYGVISDPLTKATCILQKGVRIKGGKAVFLNETAKALWEELEKRNCVHIVCGKFPKTKIIPVSDFAGYLSETEVGAKLKANANFFIMDPFDCATVYDQVGVPFGLCVKEGKVINPPLFQREALLVDRKGQVSIREVDVCDLEVEIAGVRYVHGKNATFYTRPYRKKTPNNDGICIVVVGTRVVAVKESGPVDIPSSGFVIRVDAASFVKPRTLADGTPMKTCVFCDVPTGYVDAKPGDEVIYHGLEDVQFGLQIGNSIVRDGKKTLTFISKFYNIYHLEPVPFPPSLYPMDFEKARAARMALGADKDGKPVLFWAEGKGKLSYEPGVDSTGASLSEMAEIAEDLGLHNAVNLDGGGSAQILLDGQKHLRISDRKTHDNSDAERLVPFGLIVK